MTNDSKPHRVWYPPFSIGFLAVICLMKACLQIQSIFIFNKILQTVPSQPPTTPVIPWQPIALMIVLLITAIGLWFEQSWARWIARVWASFDVVTRLLFSLGIVGTIGPHFNWSGWAMAISFFGFAYFSKFRREYPSTLLFDDDEWDDAPFDLYEKLRGAYHDDVVLKNSYVLHEAGTTRTVVDRFLTSKPRKIGTLPLPTGRLVAMDPCYGPGYDRVFEGRVPPGRYPVYLTTAMHATEHDERVAFAVIRFNDKPPIAWEPASLSKVENPEIPVDSIDSMFTDSAIGCYIDAGLLKECRDNGVRFPELSQLHSVLSESRPGNVVKLPGADNAKGMAIFYTGRGSGVFHSYWGLDDEGSICALATDFELGGGVDSKPPMQVYKVPMKRESD